MKKKYLIAMGMTLSLTLGLAVSLGLKDEAMETNADDSDSYQTYVPINTGWIENTDGSAESSLDSLIRDRNDRFWSGNSDSSNWDSQERTFNSTDYFVDTIHRANGGEGWRGAYRTPELELHDNNHRYISFLFGGGSGDIFINIYQITSVDGHGSGDRITNIKTSFDSSGSFDDKDNKLNAPISCNMVFRYYELPAEIQPTDRFLIYVRDGKTSDYGGFTFGDVYINQSLEDVARNFSVHKTQVKLNEFTSDWNKNANEYVLNYYATDDYYASVREAEKNLIDANDDFETLTGLSNWAYDSQNSVDNDGNLISLDFRNIVSDTEYKQDGYFTVGMPYNKTGNYYIKAENSGIDEASKYRLVSNEFTLSGSGIISAKLGGGTAVLELLDENFNTLVSTATNEATYPNALRPGFKNGTQDETHNLALSGVRLNTMSRVYLDCSAYLNTKVRVALSDGRTGGEWGLAYFDELVTYYEDYPSFKIDIVSQDTCKIAIFDEYIGSESSVFGAAFKNWRAYLTSVRNENQGTNYCDILTNTEVKNIITEYKSLSETSKKIVCGSDDFERIGNEDNWYEKSITVYSADDTYNLARSIQYIASENNIPVVVYSQSLIYGNHMQILGDFNYSIFILIAASTLLIAVSLIIFIRKKKYNK